VSACNVKSLGACRHRSVVLAVVALLGVALFSAQALARETPRLGRKTYRSEEGFGKVRPHRIYLGGDPTGLVKHIHWHHWGNKKAIGKGRGWYVPDNKAVADGHWAKARVVVWNLGHCGGHRAYRRVQWTFPGHQGSSGYRSYAIHTCSRNLYRVATPYS
jgi:hypothetical protein